MITNSPFISDNILLTQERMKNYHLDLGIPRCTLKTDIQKAYDTVDWNFLRTILYEFGFNAIMVKWIMLCVPSVTYSINVNGEMHGFVKGKRGLRLGDPMSPYLFTLVMEVLTLMLKRHIEDDGGFEFHVICHKQKIINICFADDLIMFARRNSKSAGILMDALNEFKDVSGLSPSLPNSMDFFCNISHLVKNEILSKMPFEEGKLPIKYVGVPLISLRLIHRDFKVLIERVRNRIEDWKCNELKN